MGKVVMIKNFKQKKKLLEEYNDKLALVYDEAISNPKFGWMTPKILSEFIKEYAELPCSILDIGIGTGEISKEFYEKGCKVTGIDVSAEMLEKAIQKMPNAELLKFDISNGFKNKLAGEKFDIVIAGGVLEFVEDLGSVFKDVSNLLAGNGVFAFSYELQIPNHEIQKHKISELMEDSFYVYRNKRTELEKLLDKYDFKILKKKEATAYYKYIEAKKIPVVYDFMLVTFDL